MLHWQQACKHVHNLSVKTEHCKHPILQTLPKTSQLSDLLKSPLKPVNRCEGKQSAEQTLAVKAENER